MPQLIVRLVILALIVFLVVKTWVFAVFGAASVGLCLILQENRPDPFRTSVVLWYAAVMVAIAAAAHYFEVLLYAAVALIVVDLLVLGIAHRKTEI